MDTVDLDAAFSDFFPRAIESDEGSTISESSFTRKDGERCA
jgi:hypothetical protein